MMDANLPPELNRAPSSERGARRSFFRSLVWLRELAIAVLLAAAIMAFVYQPVKVEGTSMAPGLDDQERIVINKFTYRFAEIARGDIVVFRYPRDPRKSFVKRVVGLPGETVEIKQGVLHINSLPLDEGYLLAGETVQAGSLSPQKIPADHYFVLGDRRRSSNDSRAWGAVHREFIYGKAVFAYWPLERFGAIESAAER